jgi:hypothetical protein
VAHLLTKAIARLGGGYDYSVCYLIDNALLIDTGFPWARKSLRKYLLTSHVSGSLRAAIDTHAHVEIPGYLLMIHTCRFHYIHHRQVFFAVLFHPLAQQPEAFRGVGKAGGSFDAYFLSGVDQRNTTPQLILSHVQAHCVLYILHLQFEVKGEYCTDCSSCRFLS